MMVMCHMTVARWKKVVSKGEMLLKRLSYCMFWTCVSHGATYTIVNCVADDSDDASSRGCQMNITSSIASLHFFAGLFQG